VAGRFWHPAPPFSDSARLLAAVPEVLRELPKALHNIFESPITVGARCAIVLNIFLPEEFIELEEDEFDPQASVLQVMQNPDVTARDEPAKPAMVTQSNH
jgi:xanthine permease XanP